MDVLVATAIVIAVALLAAGGYWLYLRRAAKRVLARARRQAGKTLEEANRTVDAKIREAEIAAKEMLLQARSELEETSRRERQELEERARELRNRRESLDLRETRLEDREESVLGREERLDQREEEISTRHREAAAHAEEKRRDLERVAGLTVQQAREELKREIEDETRVEAARMMKRIEDEAREEANRNAQRILGMAVQRSASDYVAETTASVVMLPSDDMKGRIIGREGRNIRALEGATGVDLIVDDTPEAVVLSGFDPFRREIARVALERLIDDGRIHPGRIEEIVEKTRAEFDEHIVEEGEAALLELKIPSMHPELTKIVGRLKFRTSYGQNVLHHSKEVAFLAGSMAAELDADVEVCRRAGLLHDVGKAVDREMDGGHVEIGVELLRKYGESEEVIHAMACHHGDHDPETVEAVLVTAADALSAARPGARREVLENYVKRLEKLEELAGSFPGVEKCYAIQAGREIRVIVDSETIDDDRAYLLSREIAKKIEAELTYPGKVKVHVIREVRAVEYAR
ncbi:MAG: ribonuclease Y [Thermoanaerobaculia bacterium]|nr:ribonuclease Y [Thermoanaerobaculia bacterium]